MQQILQSKLTAYLAYAQQKGPVKQFGIERMQVLFPTTGETERLTRFVRATKAVTDGAGSRRFLFGPADALFGDVLAEVWTDGTGAPASVME